MAFLGSTHPLTTSSQRRRGHTANLSPRAAAAPGEESAQRLCTGPTADFSTISPTKSPVSLASSSCRLAHDVLRHFRGLNGKFRSRCHHGGVGLANYGFPAGCTNVTKVKFFHQDESSLALGSSTSTTP